MNLEEYYRTEHWRNISKERKSRDGWRCVVCAAVDKLQVHHNCYDRLGHEDLFDLVTLCERCHKIYHVEVMRNISRVALMDLGHFPTDENGNLEIKFTGDDA